MIEEVRCGRCNKKLGEKLSGTIQIVCPRCGHFNPFMENLTKRDTLPDTISKVKAP